MPSNLDLGSSAAATTAAAAVDDNSSAVRKPRAVMTTWCTRQLEDSDVFGDVFHGGDSSGRGLFDALRQQQLQLQQGGSSAVHVEDVTGYDPAVVQHAITTPVPGHNRLLCVRATPYAIWSMCALFLAESYALWDKPVHELCSTNAAVAAACGLAQHSHSWRIIQWLMYRACCLHVGLCVCYCLQQVLLDGGSPEQLQYDYDDFQYALNETGHEQPAQHQSTLLTAQLHRPLTLLQTCSHTTQQDAAADTAALPLHPPRHSAAATVSELERGAGDAGVEEFTMPEALALLEHQDQQGSAASATASATARAAAAAARDGDSDSEADEWTLQGGGRGRGKPIAWLWRPAIADFLQECVEQ
eukprot:6593-Heterococcus_DN1.PRE.1